MSIAVLATAPAFEPVRQVDGKIVPPSTETAIRWGDKHFSAPPAIGAQGKAVFNRMGAVVVTGYFIEEGFLGVVATLLDAETIKRNRGETTVYLFGTEIRPLNHAETVTLAFEETDKAWSAELAKRFGKQAGNARYEKRGCGEPGSDLERIYKAREAAERAFNLLPR